MSRERLSMRKTREILRLKYAEGLSHRAIVRSCQVGLGTVNDYVSRAQRAGLLSWPLPEGLTDAELEATLFPKPSPREPAGPAVPDWEWVKVELRRKGVTRFLLWEEYHRQHPAGYGYSHFCDLFREYCKISDPRMHQVHKAGEKLFVDYAGQTLSVLDCTTGETVQVQIFVAAWGASDYTYAEATWSQTQPDWIGSHVRAVYFFGGCPHILVPDNITTGVKTPCRYEPVMTRSYEEMAAHHGMVIIPARVRKPRDKAVVEKHVQHVEQRILAPLRDRTFVGLNDCNRAIGELLEDLNNRPFQKMPASRRQLFAELDAPAMLPLPLERYEYGEWTVARLGFHYHLCVDGAYYSAPHALINKKLDVRLSRKVVEIFHRSERVASHVRSYTAGCYTTDPAHMPSSHREYAEWTPERIVQWAGCTGPNAAKAVELILNRHMHPEQAFRSCMGVISLGRKYGAERLESACARAVSFGCPTYRSLKSILQTKLDTTPLPAAEQERQIPDHTNIRGAGYFQQTLALYDKER